MNDKFSNSFELLIRKKEFLIAMLYGNEVNRPNIQNEKKVFFKWNVIKSYETGTKIDYYDLFVSGW